jgi:hypothetical protein
VSGAIAATAQPTPAFTGAVLQIRKPLKPRK